MSPLYLKRCVLGTLSLYPHPGVQTPEVQRYKGKLPESVCCEAEVVKYRDRASGKLVESRSSSEGLGFIVPLSRYAMGYTGILL